MTRLFSAVMGIFAFVVMCGLGLLQRMEGVEVSLGIILLRAALAMAGFLVLGWIVGSAGIRVVSSEVKPKAAGAPASTPAGSVPTTSPGVPVAAVGVRVPPVEGGGTTVSSVTSSSAPATTAAAKPL